MLTSILKKLKSNKAPSGVVVSGADGTLYFLTDKQAARASFKPNKLYAAFLLRKSAPPKHGPSPDVMPGCRSLRDWLDGHSPNSALWRQVCLTYFEYC